MADRAPSRHENREDHCLLATGQAGLRDGHRGGDAQEQVLAVHPDIAASRPADLTGVKLSRASSTSALGAARRAWGGAPLPERQEQEQHPGVSLMAYTAVDGPLLLATLAVLAMMSTSPPTTTSPVPSPPRTRGVAACLGRDQHQLRLRSGTVRRSVEAPVRHRGNRGPAPPYHRPVACWPIPGDHACPIAWFHQDFEVEPHAGCPAWVSPGRRWHLVAVAAAREG
jgi:hypothetical protein